jgi:hypothetical protein
MLSMMRCEPILNGKAFGLGTINALINDVSIFCYIKNVKDPIFKVIFLNQSFTIDFLVSFCTKSIFSLLHIL